MGGMKTPKTHEELMTEIERLVRGYLAQVQCDAQQAVVRAVAGAGGTPAAAVPTRRQGARAKRSAPAQRRSAAELAELRDALSDAVRRLPGSSIRTLADALGRPVQELDTPMRQLRRAGRVRTVGAYHRMRYFPAPASADSAT